MIGPGGGAVAAHLQYVEEHGVDSAGWITPDVMEDTKCTDVDHSFHR